MNEFKEMMLQYRDSLLDLQRRREELGKEIGVAKDRMAALDEEIDEMEEALMFLRRYAGP